MPNVVACIPEPWRRGETLEENFRNAAGPLAWGKLVVPGEKPNTYRLAPIPQATLTVDIRTPGMRVSVFYPADSDSQGRALELEELGPQQLAVPPGEYRVQVTDSQVHWLTVRRNQPIPARTENCTLADGGSATFVVERRWQDYVSPKCTVDQAELPELDRIETPYRLMFDRLEHIRNARDCFFMLTRPQAAFVSRLFQGLADGKPEVAEEDLLKAAEVQSMYEVFPGLYGKSPERGWGPLFIPGDQPKTWRLNVPQLSPPPSVKVEFRRAEKDPAEGLTEAAILGTAEKVYLYSSADATNEDIAAARVEADNQQKPVVEITFTDAGAKKLAKLRRIPEQTAGHFHGWQGHFRTGRQVTDVENGPDYGPFHQGGSGKNRPRDQRSLETPSKTRRSVSSASELRRSCGTASLAESGQAEYSEAIEGCLAWRK